MITDHEEAAVGDLDHFVAVENRVMAALAGGDPVFDDAVTEFSVADDGVLFGIGGGAEGLDPRGSGSGGEAGEEVAAGRHRGGVEGA